MSSEHSYLNATAQHKTSAARWLVCSEPSSAPAFLTASLIGAVTLLYKFFPASILPQKMFQMMANAAFQWNSILLRSWG